MLSVKAPVGRPHENVTVERVEVDIAALASTAW